MTTDLTVTNAVESALVVGDLSKLTQPERISYYRSVCDSMGLNPLTRPFDYITLNGRLTLYARKDATDQLRRLRNISIEKPDITFQDDWVIVTVAAHDTGGRTDSDIGVVSKKDMRGELGNVIMKAVTKAKRRVTLSICGLGMLDETEVETIPDARPVNAPLIEAIPQPAERATGAQPTEQPAHNRPANWPATDLPDTKTCHVHDAPMDLNYSAQKGKFFYSHMESGTRCFGHEQKAQTVAAGR